MKQEDIEHAAREHARRNFPPVESVNMYRTGKTAGYISGFIAGAEWMGKQSLWISVDERLPELMERVLVVYRLINKISICIMKRIPHDSSDPSNPKWHWSLTNNKDDVFAWRPLPYFDKTLFNEKG